MRGPKSKRKGRVSTIDPFCNIGARKAMHMTKLNQLDQPPDKPDDQPIPQKLKDLLQAMKPKKRQNSEKQGIKRPQQDVSATGPVSRRARKQRQKKNINPQIKEKTDDSVNIEKEEKLTRLPWESDKNFLRRVRCQADMDIQDELDRINLLGKHEVDVLEKVAKKKISERSKERFEKLKAKKKSRQFEKNLDKLEKQFFVDKVEFGEVAARPPDISFQPRKSQLSNTAGKRTLLLSSLLDKTAKPVASSPRPAKSTGHVQKTKKQKYKRRKDMDNAEKRKFDANREDAILAYRQAKAKAIAQRTTYV